MAALSDDPWMLAALREGAGDYFDTYMMPVCFPSINMSNITAIEKKEFRVQVKTVVYGLAFDRGDRAIGFELGISQREARTIIDNYLSTANKFAQWREDVKEAAVNPLKRDLLVSPFGRRFQSEVVTHVNMAAIKREALAFLPQATSSDICLVTAIRVHDWIKSQGAHIVALVHDAILVEIPEKHPPTAQKLADKIGKHIQSEFRITGEAVFGDKVPFLSEYSFARSWGDLK
jgi:DNA polymerase I-like protein with 3'-5' exonuclease and polymerase domains